MTATASTVAATTTTTTDNATDVDGCANDICVLELLQPARDTATPSSHTQQQPHRTAHREGRVRGGGLTRRRCSVGGKCIWPASDWLRKLRRQQAPHGEEEPPCEREPEREQRHKRRSSVLLMVLLSGNEMEAKAVVVSEQQAIKTTPQPAHRLSRHTTAEDIDEAIDALWL